VRVVLASRNRGKLREIVPLLDGLGFDLATVDEVAPACELREDADTFEANALAKARQAAAATGLAAIADDSGLEVDALAGAPGVYSARYAGLPSDDARNNVKLLEALRDVPAPRRRARFRCVAVFLDPAAGVELLRGGDCAGEILDQPRGDLGFGYDPLFLIPALGRTMAELPLAEKNRLSHRAAAFRALAAAIADGQARRGSSGYRSMR
jgi:XTP/dITP diphosphohydrolase